LFASGYIGLVALRHETFFYCFDPNATPATIAVQFVEGLTILCIIALGPAFLGRGLILLDVVVKNVQVASMKVKTLVENEGWAREQAENTIANELNAEATAAKMLRNAGAAPIIFAYVAYQFIAFLIAYAVAYKPNWFWPKAAITIGALCLQGIPFFYLGYKTWSRLGRVWIFTKRALIQTSIWTVLPLSMVPKLGILSTPYLHGKICDNWSIGILERPLTLADYLSGGFQSCARNTRRVAQSLHRSTNIYVVRPIMTHANPHIRDVNTRLRLQTAEFTRRTGWFSQSNSSKGKPKID
jgi:hypothetical protein